MLRDLRGQVAASVADRCRHSDDRCGHETRDEPGQRAIHTRDDDDGRGGVQQVNGRSGVQTLVAMRQGAQPRTDQVTVLPVHLVVRESTGPART